MTIKEAKNFMRELEEKLVEDAYISSEENEKYSSELLEFIGFALKNLLPDDEIDNNENKCMTGCPFYTAENRDICSKLSISNNCFQCIATSYKALQKEASELRNQNKKIPLLEDEITQLKAKLYDKNNGDV